MFFFDSYAMLEIVFGNKNYARFKGAKFITLKVDLFEVHHRLLRQLGLQKANEALKIFSENVVDFSIGDIIESSKFRLTNRKRKFSMVDCIGYIVALRNGAKFLTGDKEFKDIENVEFVK